MPYYRFTCKARYGRTRGWTKARDLETAQLQLKRRGVAVETLEETRPSALQRAHDVLASSIPFLTPTRRVTDDDLAQLTAQLATMTEARAPLAQGLRMVARDIYAESLRDLVVEIACGLEQGMQLSEAIQRTGGFPHSALPLISRGEETGALSAALTQLAGYIKRRAFLTRRFGAHLFYPAALIFSSTGIVVFLTRFIIPTFAGMFTGLGDGGELPATTRALLSFSDTLNLYWYLILLGLLAFAGVVAIFNIDHRLRRRVPLVGPFLHKMGVTRFAHMLSVALGMGIPVTRAVDLAADASMNNCIARRVRALRPQLEQGAALSEVLEETRAFPRSLVWMASVGEQSRQLVPNLKQAADLYAAEMDSRGASLEKMTVPICVCIIGAFVGFIVISLFSPLVRLSASIGY